VDSEDLSHTATTLVATFTSLADDDRDSLTNTSTTSGTFSFDTTDLVAGEYPIIVTIYNSTPNLSYQKFLKINVLDNLPSGYDYAMLADSNQNGLTDVVETNAMVQASTILDLNTAKVYAEPGVQLKAGTLAKYLSNGVVAPTTNSEQQIIAKDSTTSTDFNYSNDAVINVNASGKLPGLDYNVVIALPEPLPANAVLRQYFSDLEVWLNIVKSDDLSHRSAPKQANGECPSPNSTAYTDYVVENDETRVRALEQGDECIQLVLTDGGNYDLSSYSNGEVELALSVSTRRVAKIEANIDTNQREVGETFMITSTAYDADNNPVENALFRIGSSDHLVATINTTTVQRLTDSNGMIEFEVSANFFGSAVIGVTIDDLTQAFTVIVLDPTLNSQDNNNGGIGAIEWWSIILILMFILIWYRNIKALRLEPSKISKAL